MTIENPAIDQWEAVYYTNPIPLSSRSLLAFALLFDRVHIPGVSIPQHELSAADKAAVKAEFQQPLPQGAERLMLQPSHNLVLWALEQPTLAAFVHLPDGANLPDARRLMPQAFNLIDDTYGAGVSKAVIGMVATAAVSVPALPADVIALTWPLYQARALQYAYETGLPLVSDDLNFVPPLPEHRNRVWNTKTLAQQLAVEAVSLVLPKFQSVEPSVIPEFRDSIQALARPFRVEMVKMTAEVGAAIAAGADEQKLKALCSHVAQSKVLPALNALSRQLNEPLRPWHRTAIDVTEAGLSAATAAATSLPEVVLGWALYRGAKIASEYAKLYEDRQGLKRSGLAYLLKIGKPLSTKTTSQWDLHDWRCSGDFDIPDPATPVIRERQGFVEAFQSSGSSIRTVRRVWQHATASFVQAVPPRERS